MKKALVVGGSGFIDFHNAKVTRGVTGKCLVMATAMHVQLCLPMRHQPECSVSLGFQ